MDHYQDNKDVLFIVTTNSSEHFNEALKSRLEDAVFKIDKPNEHAREQAFVHLIEKKNGSNIFDDECLKQLVKHSNGYTYRQIKKLVHEVYRNYIDSGKKQLKFEDIRHLMGKKSFNTFFWPPLFRGCEYKLSEKTKTELVLCATYENLPLLVQLMTK